MNYEQFYFYLKGYLQDLKNVEVDKILELMKDVKPYTIYPTWTSGNTATLPYVTTNPTCDTKE